MDNDALNFNYNACSITVLVAGSKQQGSGFIYITPPTCQYNYILTAKHIFQEGGAAVDISRLSDICIEKYLLQPKLEEMVLPQSTLDKRAYFAKDMDLVILKVDKEWLPKAKRIFVRNIADVDNGSWCQSVSFPSMLREDRTLFNFTVTDNELFCLKLEEQIKNVEHIRAISGSGIYLKSEPYLLGVVSAYRHPDFELNQIRISKIDWNRVNADLKSIGWLQLETRESKYSKIADNLEIINIGDVNVNNVSLDFGRSIENLQYDLRDDWFFDPLHYADMCNKSFVLKSILR